MKIGDLIRRKDMPSIQACITGENKDRRAWDVELLGYLPGFRDKKGMVFKDDDRWETITCSGITTKKGRELV